MPISNIVEISSYWRLTLRSETVVQYLDKLVYTKVNYLIPMAEPTALWPETNWVYSFDIAPGYWETIMDAPGKNPTQWSI
ncbi:hypothetical protein NMY22_g8771 [Coprinellus aureogranulatus]|nr:hypothetical protein NMY22_g8771 [Coprinellus aureogranulatus]